MTRSTLLYTQDFLANVKGKLKKTDIVDHCKRERATTKWKFHKFTIVAVVSSVLKVEAMGCKGTVLRFEKPQGDLSKFRKKNTRQPYNDNLCLFTTPGLHLYGIDRLETETSKTFTFFLKYCEEGITQKFNVFIWTLFQKLKTYCSPISFCTVLISLTENSLLSLLLEVFKSMTKVSNFYVTTITFATSITKVQHQKLSMHYLWHIFLKNW